MFFHVIINIGEDMQKIIVLIGDTGSGKDYFLDIVNEYPEIEVVKRHISRKPRDGEEPSISSVFSCSVDDIKSLDYYYQGVQDGNYYGVSKDDLTRILASGYSPIVTLPNYEICMQLEEDFPDMVVPFFIYRGISDEELDLWKDSLRKRGSSEEEILKRESKRSKYFEELYLKHTDYFASNVVLNLFGLTTKEDIMLQFEGLCLKNDIDLTLKIKKAKSL